jgi:hypothetical protein
VSGSQAAKWENCTYERDQKRKRKNKKFLPNVHGAQYNQDDVDPKEESDAIPLQLALPIF